MQRELLVGLGVQPRRHGEERVEAQQHLREYSEYQRPQAPARQRRPGAEYSEYPDPPYVQRRPPASAAREQSTVTSTAGWAYSVRTQWVQRTSASSMNCEKSSIALPAAGERRYSTGYSTGHSGAPWESFYAMHVVR